MKFKLYILIAFSAALTTYHINNAMDARGAANIATTTLSELRDGALEAAASGTGLVLDVAGFGQSAQEVFQAIRKGDASEAFVQGKNVISYGSGAWGKGKKLLYYGLCAIPTYYALKNSYTIYSMAAQGDKSILNYAFPFLKVAFSLSSIGLLNKIKNSSDLADEEHRQQMVELVAKASSIESNVTKIGTDVVTLAETAKTTQENVENIKTAVATLDQTTQGIKSTVEKTAHNVSGLNKKAAKLETSIETLNETAARLEQSSTETGAAVIQLSEDSKQHAAGLQALNEASAQAIILLGKTEELQKKQHQDVLEEIKNCQEEIKSLKATNASDTEDTKKVLEKTLKTLKKLKEQVAMNSLNDREEIIAKIVTLEKDCQGTIQGLRLQIGRLQQSTDEILLFIRNNTATQEAQANQRPLNNRNGSLSMPTLNRYPTGSLLSQPMLRSVSSMRLHQSQILGAYPGSLSSLANQTLQQ